MGFEIEFGEGDLFCLETNGELERKSGNVIDETRAEYPKPGSDAHGILCMH